MAQVLFGSGTGSISLAHLVLAVVLVLIGATIFKGSVVSNRIGMNLAGLFFK